MSASLTRSTALMLGWQICRAGLQALWAIGLARLLGVTGYGTLAGIAGLATALGALSGLGFGLLLLQRVSRSPHLLAACWRQALWTLGGSAMLLGGVYVVLAHWWLQSPLALPLLLAIAIPELLLAPLATLASYAFQARERMGWAGAMYALPPAGNVIALLACFLVGRDAGLPGYLHWHLGGAALSGASAITAVTLLMRLGWMPSSPSRRDLSEASGFLAMRVVDTGLGTLDKSVVFRLAGAEVAGHYTASYRLAALIALPAVSLAISAGPRLFRQAGDAISQDIFLRRLLRAGIVLGLASVPLAWGLSFALPLLFGHGFDHAAELARINSLFPALLGLASLGCTMLMTRGRKRVRVGLQLGALLLLGVTMWLLVPALAGAGAIVALNLTYLLLVLALWWALWRPSTQ